MREAEEVEGLGLPLSKLLPLLGRVAAKADQPGFVRVQRRFELAHSFLELSRNVRAMPGSSWDNSACPRKPMNAIPELLDHLAEAEQLERSAGDHQCHGLSSRYRR
jgi:hypothetical protein